MRQTFERSSTEGAQLRILSEETRTANANIAPDITRLQTRESQLPSRVSAMRNHETELQGQSQHIQQENTRINADWNQFDEHWESRIGEAIPDVKPQTQSFTY